MTATSRPTHRSRTPRDGPTTVRPRLAPDRAGDARPVRLEGAVAHRLLARRRAGSSGSACGTPFFPRVLVHLVGLDHVVLERVAVQADAGALLEPVPQGQQ